MSLNFTKIDGYKMTDVMISSWSLGASNPTSVGAVKSPRDAASGQAAWMTALLLPE